MALIHKPISRSTWVNTTCALLVPCSNPCHKCTSRASLIKSINNPIYYQTSLFPSYSPSLAFIMIIDRSFITQHSSIDRSQNQITGRSLFIFWSIYCVWIWLTNNNVTISINNFSVSNNDDLLKQSETQWYAKETSIY